MLISFRIDTNALDVDIRQECLKHKEIFRWAYVAHDFDTEHPHYHILLDVLDVYSVSEENVRDWFGFSGPILHKYTLQETLGYFLKVGCSKKFNLHSGVVVSNFDVESELKQLYSN